MTIARATSNGADDKRVKALRRREIAWRYRRREKQPFSMPALRCAELARLFCARYGPQLPDDDAGRADARLMAHHLAKMSGDPQRRVVDWLDVHAPWLISSERSKLLAEINTKPRRWRAEKLAQLLNLTEVDRQRLKITTIGSIDVTRAERTKRRKQAKREFIAAARRANGAVPRAEYEAQSLARTKPWRRSACPERHGIASASQHRETGPYPA
jgi:hypothetical protein